MFRTRFTRRLPAAVAAAGLALAVAACGGGSTDSAETAAQAAQLDPNADLTKQQLTVTVWDGYTPQELQDMVKNELKISDINVTLHDTNEVAMSKLTASGDHGIDVAFVSGQYAQALNEQGLLEPIHAELIPNLANLYPEATQLSYDKGNKFSVPYTWGTTGICYRADLVRRPPKSWNDLLDPPAWARGRVTMMTADRALALPALKALGYSVNTVDDERLASAARRLLAAKRTLLAYDDVTAGERLLRGEAVLAQTRDGACPTGEPYIRFTVPREGGDLWTETMVISRAARDPEAAHAFVNHMLAPGTHAWVPEHTGYKVPNRPAMERALARGGGDRPQLRMTPADLLRHEPLVDLGEHAGRYARLAARVAEG